MKRLCVFCSILVLGLFIATKGIADPIYFNDFQTHNTAGWNTTKIGTDLAGESFLGLFGAYNPEPKPDPWNGEQVTLTLDNLAAGVYNISFDLYTINTWDGDDYDCGPDTIEFLINGSTVFSGWFASGGNNSAGLTASEYDSLSFEDDFENSIGNVGYSPNFAFTHTGGSLTLSFIGTPSQPEQLNGNTGFYDEPWALDNVSVSSLSEPIPEPATILLFGTGLASLAGARFRRKKK